MPGHYIQSCGLHHLANKMLNTHERLAKSQHTKIMVPPSPRGCNNDMMTLPPFL